MVLTARRELTAAVPGAACALICSGDPSQDQDFSSFPFGMTELVSALK